MSELGKRLSEKLKATRTSPRSFAEAVGCHYSTVYSIIKKPEREPHNLMLEALESGVTRLDELHISGVLPFPANLSLSEKTSELVKLFQNK